MVYVTRPYHSPVRERPPLVKTFTRSFHPTGFRVSTQVDEVRHRDFALREVPVVNDLLLGEPPDRLYQVELSA